VRLYGLLDHELAEVIESYATQEEATASRSLDADAGTVEVDAHDL
jgi:hypothetical protein